MSKIINYSKGATIKGPIPYIGLILIIAGFIIFSTSMFVYGFLLIPIGLILFLNIRGVLVDYTNNRIKNYIDFVLFKTGDWEEVRSIDSLVLTKFLESTTFGVLRNYGIYMGLGKTINTKTYDLYLICKGDAVLLKEFVDYQKAWKFLEKEGKELNLPVKDEIRILHKKSQVNRRR